MELIKDKDYEMAAKSYEYFDVNHEDDDKKTLVDYVWENLDGNKILTNLLYNLVKTSCRYPQQNGKPVISFFNISKEIKDHVDECERMHGLVEKGESLRNDKFLTNNDKCCHFFDKNNESLMSHALRKENNDTVLTLWWRCRDNNLSIDEKNVQKLKEFLLLSSQKIRDDPVLPLFSVSSVVSRENDIPNASYHILSAFKTLAKNKECEHIVKFASMWKNLHICFDFQSNAIEYMDPKSSDTTLGNISKSNSKVVVKIGAKKLLDEKTKNEVLSVIIHELCHFAMIGTYMNNYNPYPFRKDNKQSQMERRFEKVNAECERFIAECVEIENNEEIVSSVYDNYDKEEHHCELIVRAVQMIVFYKGKDDLIDKKKEHFPMLFKYHNNLKEPIKEAFTVLKLLQEMKGSFKSLTEPMKTKILFSKIIRFEKTVKTDFVTTLYQSFGDNDSFYKDLLTPNYLHGVLINNEKIFVGGICSITSENKFIERNFIGVLNAKDEINPLDVGLKNIFLADNAGSGKTTFFQEHARKLKYKHNDYMVSYIKLREHKDYFENVKQLTVDGILRNVLKIEGPDKIFKMKYFKKLIEIGKAIFLFDGYDEICPNYSETFTKVIRILNESKKNTFWISTRWQFKHDLLNELDFSVYKFASFSADNKEQFIKSILEAQNKTNVEQLSEIEVNEAFEKIKIILNNIESKSEEESYMDNPLMIKYLSELHKDKKMKLKFNLNVYEIFQKIFEKQVLEFDDEPDKIKNGDSNAFGEFSLIDVHQVFALKFLFENFEQKYQKQLREFDLVKRWNFRKNDKDGKGAKLWTAEKIQRFGFLTVNLENEDKNSIDFLHKMHAEFFTSKFITSCIFCEHSVCKAEFNKIFQLLIIITCEIKSFKVECDFLIDYARFKNNLFNIKMENSICEHRDYIHGKIINFISNNDASFKSAINFWSNFLREDKTDNRLLWIFWSLDRKDNFLKKILLSRKHKSCQVLKIVLKIISDSFGSNWNEKFNFDVEDVTNDEDDKEPEKFSTGFLKLLDLVETTYSEDEGILFYNMYVQKWDILSELDDETCKEILERGYKYLNLHMDIFFEVVKQLINCASPELLPFYENKCNEYFKNDTKKLSTILLKMSSVKRLIHNEKEN